MEKQVINCRRSRALSAICAQGGRVIGFEKNHVVPVIRAIPPAGGVSCSVFEVLEVVNGVRQRVLTSVIQGCAVIWG